MPETERRQDGAGAVARYGEQLALAIEEALGPWVESAVAARLLGGVPNDLKPEIAAAAERAVSDVCPKIRALLALDIDEQWTNPLTLVRTAVAYPSAILANAGVEPVVRDATEAAINPDDVYALSPVAFGDLGAEVHEPGLVWGAAKAHLHLQRRRHEQG